MIMYYPNLNNLSAEFKSYLRSHTIFEHFRKGQIILSPGNAEHKAWFIKKGIAKIFYYTEEGKQITISFFKEGEILTCVENFFGDTHSDHYIEVLEDCDLYSITKSQFEKCCELFAEANQVAREIILNYIAKCNQRSDLLTLQAKEKYIKFNKQFNTARLSVIDLSSFLLLNPSYLSTIRQQK